MITDYEKKEAKVEGSSAIRREKKAKRKRSTNLDPSARLLLISEKQLPEHLSEVFDLERKKWEVLISESSAEEMTEGGRRAKRSRLELQRDRQSEGQLLVRRPLIHMKHARMVYSRV